MLPFSKSALGREAWRLLAPGALEGLSDEVPSSAGKVVEMKPEIEFLVAFSNAEGVIKFDTARARSKAEAAFIVGSRNPTFPAKYVTVEELEK